MIRTRHSLLATVLIAAWGAAMVARHWGGIDLTDTQFAARFFADGQFDQVYAAPREFFGYGVPEAWAALAAADLLLLFGGALSQAVFAVMLDALGPVRGPLLLGVATQLGLFALVALGASRIARG